MLEVPQRLEGVGRGEVVGFVSKRGTSVVGGCTLGVV